MNDETHKFSYNTDSESIAEDDLKAFSEAVEQIYIPMSENDKTELFDFCKVHVQEFGAMPFDFEIDDKRFAFGEIVEALTDEQHTELSQIMKEVKNS